jgi:tRNA (cytidine/uridine-2'-O-)-methyltransferase
MKKPPDICFYGPEIPGNTGTVIRLCAVTGANLHLIEPISFDMDGAKLKRAGLDYHEYADVKIYKTFDEFVQKNPNKKIYAFRTQGKTIYTNVDYTSDDILLFGPESKGLPPEIYNRPEITKALKIPMVPNRRSINLALSASIALYESWRQLGFC